MSRYLTLFLQRRARLVCGWVTMTNRGLLHMHAWFLRKTRKVPRRVTLPDEWPDEFRKVGIVTSTLLSRVTESWIFYVSGYNVGWHDGTPHDGAPPAHGTTSVQYIHFHISLISFLKIQFPTLSHTKSTTSPNCFRNCNVAGALPYVPILGTSGSLANLQPTAKNQSISSIGLRNGHVLEKSQ